MLERIDTQSRCSYVMLPTYVAISQPRVPTRYPARSPKNYGTSIFGHSCSNGQRLVLSVTSDSNDGWAELQSELARHEPFEAGQSTAALPTSFRPRFSSLSQFSISRSLRPGDTDALRVTTSTAPAAVGRRSTSWQDLLPACSPGQSCRAPYTVRPARTTTSRCRGRA